MADLTLLILASILGTGYYLNKDQKVSRKTVHERKAIDEGEMPSGDNVYHSTHYKKTRGQELSLAEKRYRGAHVDPEGTNIISRYHNSLVRGVREGITDDLDEQNYIQDRKKFINETSDPAAEINIDDSPMFNPLVYTSASSKTDESDPSHPGFSPVNSTERFAGPQLSKTDLEAERNPLATGALIRKDTEFQREEDKYNLSGGWHNISENFAVTNNENVRGMEHFNSYTVHGPRNSNNPFMHNNMVPFISLKASQYTDPYSHQQLMERFTGQTNDETELRARPKREIESLYDGTPHQSFIYGAPSDLSYQIDRHWTSNLKQNVSPTEQTRVGPGLNYGYEARPSDGFHPLYRPKFRNVDELRVNKKNVYEGRILHGKEMVDKPEQIGNVYKRRPDRFGLLGPKRWNKTTGGHIAPQVYENFVAYKQDREDTHVPYSGIAGNTELQRNRPSYVLETECGPVPESNSMASVTQFPRVNQFAQAEPRNTYSPGHNQSYFDYAKDGYVAYEEERQTTEGQLGDHRLNVHNPGLKRGQQQPYDTAKPTTKQTLNVKDYFGVVNSKDLERTQQQPYDIARVTTKQTLNVKDYMGVAGNKELERTQQQPYDTARVTTKQTLNVKDYMGVSSANSDNVRPRSYADMYNATGKNRQESILPSRSYGPNRETGAWNGVCSVNMQIKDRAGYDITKYGPNLDRLYTHAPTVNIQFENTTSRNQRDRHGIRQPETFLVEQFNNNPYTQSLSSAPRVNCNMPDGGICSEDQLRKLMMADDSVEVVA